MMHQVYLSEISLLKTKKGDYKYDLSAIDTKLLKIASLVKDTMG
jgi:hypothetical protein